MNYENRNKCVMESKLDKTNWYSDDSETPPKVEETDVKETFLFSGTKTEGTDNISGLGHQSFRMLYKNLAVVSMSFLLLFTAYLSLQNLQSSLNVAEGLGTMGLTTIYCAMILSSLFLPPLLLSKLGIKWTMVLSVIAYLGYLGASFHAVWATVMPTSLALGIGAGTLWASNMAYVNELSRRDSILNAKDISYSKDRFFGIFFAVYHTGDIWGNLASSLTFSRSITDNTTETNSTCGISFCPQDESENKNLIVTDKTKIYIYSGFCLGCASMAALIMALLLDNIRAPHAKKVPSVRLLTMSMRHFMKSGYQKLLVPVTIYRGYAMAFIVSDFTAAFTSCVLGVEIVGFTMVCYGIGCSVSAFVFGRLTRWTGYLLPFVIGFILHGTVIILLFIWTPSKDVSYVFYICVTLWGVGYSVYSSLLSALYTNLFKDNADAAISCFRVLDSVGWALSFALTSFVCTYVKLTTVLILLVVSTLLICILLFHEKHLNK